MIHFTGENPEENFLLLDKQYLCQLHILYQVTKQTVEEQKPFGENQMNYHWLISDGLLSTCSTGTSVNMYRSIEMVKLPKEIFERLLNQLVSVETIKPLKLHLYLNWCGKCQWFKIILLKGTCLMKVIFGLSNL